MQSITIIYAQCDEKTGCINLKKVWVMSRGLAQKQSAICSKINLLSMYKIQMRERNWILHIQTDNCIMHSRILELNLVHIQIKLSFHTLLLCFVHESPSCLPSCLSVILDQSFIRDSVLLLFPLELKMVDVYFLCLKVVQKSFWLYEREDCKGDIT